MLVYIDPVDIACVITRAVF